MILQEEVNLIHQVMVILGLVIRYLTWKMPSIINP